LQRAAAGVAAFAEQLGVGADALAGYGEREQTRTDHLRLVLQYLGWRLPGTLEVKELEEFLLAPAMEHDWPSLLFRLACQAHHHRPIWIPCATATSRPYATPNFGQTASAAPPPPAGRR
jgi:hypothetical protein